MINDKHWSIKTALEQIEACGFECEAGPLKNNVAYQWLQGAARVGPEFWPGQGVYYEVTADVAGQRLSKWCHFYVVGVSMDSTTEARVWKYALSNDPPAPWHYGTVQHHGVASDKLRLEAPITAEAN